MPRSSSYERLYEYYVAVAKGLNESGMHEYVPRLLVFLKASECKTVRAEMSK